MNEYDSAMSQLDPYRRGLSGLGQFIPQVLDKRPDREKLEDKKNHNLEAIKFYEEQNKEIDEALELLDKHPMLEKLRNLLRKLT